MEIKVKFPKELTDVVNPEEIQVLGHGVVALDEKSDGKKYILWREHDIAQMANSLSISKEYVEERGLKDLDKIAFVEYPLNGRKTLDIFKAEE